MGTLISVSRLHVAIRLRTLARLVKVGHPTVELEWLRSPVLHRTSSTEAEAKATAANLTLVVAPQ